MISGVVCRMARAGLQMTQEPLASLPGLSILSVRCFENETGRLHANHRAALAAVLRQAGVEFDSDGKVWLPRADAAE